MKLKLMTITMASVWAAAVLSSSAQTAKSQWDGIYTVEQATRGERLYTEKKCVNCHNKDLYGFMPDMKLGPALIDTDFVYNWDGATVGEIFDKIHMTMPRSEPGTLTEQETADLLSFILQKGGYPAGTTELPPNAEQLKAIKFLGKKPAATE